MSRDKIRTAVHIDNTTRPRIPCKENKKYGKVIETVKKQTGLCVVLNTSFDKHRYPIAFSPNDDILTRINIQVGYMSIVDFL